MDLVKLRNSDYSEYENLLIRRDSLRKDGEYYYLKYLSLFGDLINEVFAKKVECISKKKKIAYCQARANRNQPINSTELDQYIETVMSDYYKELNDMINITSEAKKSKPISFFESKRIKEIYRHLAKLIHPDKRPDLAGDEVIQDLWQQITLAYTCNNLEDLQELQYRTEMYLNAHDGIDADIVIPDIEEKIKKAEDEIERILTTLPYQYKFILEDDEAVRTKTQDLEDELRSYTEYSAQLDEVLKQFNITRITA
ncbi:MAG: hypothetical protein E7185_02540 [Erysipelotrichaceae bacterium]|nr:hypothetical protein [Erysipelotrichaceae bacterium]